jgi:hypothetical protein
MDTDKLRAAKENLRNRINSNVIPNHSHLKANSHNKLNNNNTKKELECLAENITQTLYGSFK